jgi:hypothetical protein
VNVAARIAKLERSRPACPGCLQAAALVRWSSDADPPEPPPCPTCGRPQGQTVVTEIVVERSADGALVFTSPDWARFISPDVVRELVQAGADDGGRWREVTEAAKARRAAGAAPYGTHTPGERGSLPRAPRVPA